MKKPSELFEGRDSSLYKIFTRLSDEEALKLCEKEITEWEALKSVWFKSVCKKRLQNKGKKGVKKRK
jgi:hypothetical protein